MPRSWASYRFVAPRGFSIVDGFLPLESRTALHWTAALKVSSNDRHDFSLEKSHHYLVAVLLRTSHDFARFCRAESLTFFGLNLPEGLWISISGFESLGGSQNPRLSAMRYIHLWRNSGYIFAVTASKRYSLPRGRGKHRRKGLRDQVLSFLAERICGNRLSRKWKRRDQGQ